MVQIKQRGRRNLTMLNDAMRAVSGAKKEVRIPLRKEGVTRLVGATDHTRMKK